MFDIRVLRATWEHGINRVQYWRMENGQNFTLDSLFKVLDAMEITAEEFFKDIT